MKNHLIMIGLLLGLAGSPVGAQTEESDPGNFLDLSRETGKLMQATPEDEKPKVSLPEKLPPKAAVKKKNRVRKPTESSSNAAPQLTLPETPILGSRFDWGNALKTSEETEEGEDLQDFRFRFRSQFLQKKKQDQPPPPLEKVSPW